MATTPGWVAFKYGDFKGTKSHTARIGKFIDQFQGEEKFLTKYGLVHALEIRFTRQNKTSTSYKWAVAKSANKLKMIAEWLQINKEKKPRAVDVMIVVHGGQKKFWLPITEFLKTSAYGGKKGSKLNKGTKFEKDFYADSVKVLEGVTKGNGYISTIIELNNTLEGIMKEDISMVEGYGNKFAGVLEEGSANKSRPIEKSGNGFIVSTPGGATENIGSTLTDITYQYGSAKKPVYLSLKYGPTLTFFNAGVTSFFPPDQVKAFKITDKDGLDLLAMFDMNMLDFCKSFVPRTTPLPNVKAKKANITAIKELLKSGIGYGYWMVHNTKNHTVDWYEIDETYMNAASTITGDVTVYYGRKNGMGIGVNMTCESSKYKFTFNIRNKQATGPFPTHIMCDYKKKSEGQPAERPENGKV